MKAFYLVDGLNLRRIVCPSSLELATYCSVRVLSVDVRKWLEEAKHGDTFKLDRTRHHVLCLELEEFGL